MARDIKIATWNVEWMVNLFETGQPTLLTRQNKRSPGLGAKPKDPLGVANRLASVVKDVNPDILGICEGPPLRSQMETFVRELLGDQYRVYSMEDGSQSVHALVHRRLDTVLTITQLPKADPVFERIRNARTFFRFGSVKVAQKARFARLPVVLCMKCEGETTELMVVHTKSKISDLKKAIQWERKQKAPVTSAIASRQKLSVEMNVIRKYIAHRLYSGKAESVIVMGDMNDGLTRDIVDESYLLHSIVHELRGAFQHEIALMRHVLSADQLQRKRYGWTVEFADPARKGRNTRVLLDHMLYSPKCATGGKILYQPGTGCVEHEAYNRQVTRKGNGRDERPSDHRPLSARFTVP